MPYYVFEGPDGSGKTTLLQLVAKRLKESGIELETTRSPGQTELGKRLRYLVLEGDLNIDYLSRQILFMADTVNYYETYLKPRLSQSSAFTVLQDRSSYVSSLVYGMSDGLPFEPLARMLGIYQPLKASKLFVLTTPAEVCHARRMQGQEQNLYDAKPLEFYKKCCGYYDSLLTNQSIRLVLTEFVHLDNIIYVDNSDLQDAVSKVFNIIRHDLSLRELR